MGTDPVTVMAVGDLTPSRPDPDSLFAPTTDALRSADIAFGQLEIDGDELVIVGAGRGR